MDQDDTWCGGGPQPWPHCVRWGPIPEVHSPGPIFGPCLLWPISCVIKMPLGTEVGLGSRPRRHCVRWGSSSSLKRGTCPPPLFGPCLLWPNGHPSQLLMSSRFWYTGFNVQASITAKVRLRQLRRHFTSLQFEL